MEGDNGGGVKNIGWTNCDTEDVHPFTFQLPPVDFRVETSHGFCGFTGLDDIFPRADPRMFLNHHFYSSPLVPDILYCDSGSGSSGFWDHEMKIELEAKPTEHVQNQQLVLFDNNNNDNINGALVENEEMIVEEAKVCKKRGRKGKKGSKMYWSKSLSRETISQYFYMTIKEAARELNVCLTLLKKRCRDLGIRRWPHRKLNSIQDLITKVQELETEGSSSSGEGNKLIENNLRVLEQEKKMLEKIPDMQLEMGTKRLRQAFSKANYKKRKLLGLVDSSSSSSTAKDNEPSTYPDISSKSSAIILAGGVVDNEIKFLLDDCFSCV